VDLVEELKLLPVVGFGEGRQKLRSGPLDHSRGHLSARRGTGIRAERIGVCPEGSYLFHTGGILRS
jgi:hypothetical protein